ncbi:MAG: hypothetical protein AB1757_00100 [Acidobacteriota bacterium]
MKIATFFIVLFTSIFSLPILIQAQGENDKAKAEALIRDAIKVRGGAAYLKIRTLIGRGQYTAFEKGVSGIPTEFVDYIVYPDRERTEFGKGDSKYIQTNFGDEGWIYDGAQKMIRAQTEEQVKAFRVNLRHDLDAILKYAWQETGAELVYVGRREIWRNQFSEAVRINYSDGLSVTLYFDTRTKFPLMSEYRTQQKDEDGNTRIIDNQVRFARWINYNGVQFSTTQDVYRNGVQAARVFYDSVSFDAQVPDKLFAKPNNIKEVK